MKKTSILDNTLNALYPEPLPQDERTLASRRLVSFMGILLDAHIQQKGTHHDV